MIYVACNVETGDLLQVSEESISVSGHPLMVKAFDMPMPDMTRMGWDRGGLSFKLKDRSRRVTKQQLIDRLSPAEMQGILTAAKVDVAAEAWLFRFNSVTPDPDGTSIDLDDQRTIDGLTAMFGAARAAEILA